MIIDMDFEEGELIIKLQSRYEDWENVKTILPLLEEQAQRLCTKKDESSRLRKALINNV